MLRRSVDVADFKSDHDNVEELSKRIIVTTRDAVYPIIAAVVCN